MRRSAVVTYWNKDKRALIDLVSFLFDRIDDDEAVVRAQLTPTAVRQDAATDRPYATGTRGGPVRALRELAAKRMMVEMWFDGVQAEFCKLPVAGLNVADAMILALVTVYADHPLFEPGWLADAGQDPAAEGGLDNVVELRPGQPWSTSHSFCRIPPTQ
jgi:uncharacterized protein DUF6221